jgi:hypothetical protein
MADVTARLNVALHATGAAEVQAATKAVQGLDKAARAAAAQERRSIGMQIRSAQMAQRAKGAEISVGNELTKLQAQRARADARGQARTILDGPAAKPGFFARSGGMLAGMRDITVAAYGLQAGFSLIAGAVGSVINPMKEFQYQLATLQSKQNFDSDTMAEIRATAIGLGKTTMFGPTQSIEAGVQLAAAGVHGHDISKVIPNALKFAQAANIHGEEAAHIFVETGTQFGIKAEQYGRIGDIFVKAKTTATASISELVDSLRYVGPVANSAGMSLEFTASTLALLAEGGIKGSMAGTGFKRIITSLVKPAADAKKALAALHISTKEAMEGATEKGMPAFFRKLDAQMNAKKYTKGPAACGDEIPVRRSRHGRGRRAHERSGQEWRRVVGLIHGEDAPRRRHHGSGGRHAGQHARRQDAEVSRDHGNVADRTR